MDELREARNGFTHNSLHLHFDSKKLCLKKLDNGIKTYYFTNENILNDFFKSNYSVKMGLVELDKYILANFK